MRKNIQAFTCTLKYTAPPRRMAHLSNAVTSETVPNAILIKSRGVEFWSGVRSELPLLLGGVPFGIIFGVLAMQSGLLSQIQAQSMSAFIFAGSAQFIGAQLLRDNAAAIVVVATIVVVNLRHLLYSASVAPLFKHLNAGWKLLLAYLLTDESYAMGIARYTDPATLPPGNKAHWYFLGCGITMWAAWQLSTAFGVFIGTQISDDIRSLLEFAVPLTFIAVVVPNLKRAGSIAAALVSGVAILLFNTMPFNSSLLVAAAVGLATGFIIDTATRATTRTPSRNSS